MYRTISTPRHHIPEPNFDIVLARYYQLIPLPDLTLRNHFAFPIREIFLFARHGALLDSWSFPEVHLATRFDSYVYDRLPVPRAHDKC
jgi:hypothetical protein